MSLRTRLTIWYTALLCAGLVVFSGSLWLGLRSLLHGDQRNSLEAQEQGLSQYLQIEDSDQHVDLQREIDEYARSLGRGYAVTVIDPQQRVFYQTPTSATQQRVLAATAAVPLREGIFSVRLAQSVEPTDRALWLLGWLLVGTIPCFVCGSAVMGYWLSRRALTPVDRITERALRIGVNNLSERLPLPHTGDELERLTEAWNAMLARLEFSVAQITNFTADASHELRTPVAIIRLAAENALHKPRSSEEYRMALERIQRESESMTHLIADLLLLARADAADFQEEVLETHEFDLTGLARATCQDLQSAAHERQVNLAFDDPGSPARVAAEETAVRRILLILLDNALKYTPSGGNVVVRIEPQEAAVSLCVQDTGSGIPEEMRPHVFERFFRADPSRHRENGGYGLGLAIARTLARQQRASLKLENNEGLGCLFSLRFEHPSYSRFTAFFGEHQ